MKKLIVAASFFCGVAAFLLTACGNRNGIKEDDLIGSWSADLSGETCIIQFYADGDDFLYQTKNFFDRGQFMVNRRGEVLLRDRYGDQRRLAVQKADGELSLQYLDGLVPYNFTRYVESENPEPAESEIPKPEVPSEGGLLEREKLDLYGEAAKRILEYGPWAGIDSTQQMSASDGIISVYGWQEDYVITAAEPINGGIEVHLKSISGEYIVQIIETRDTPTSEGEWTYPTGYKLLISYNGGEWTAFFREGYVSMSTG